MSGCVHGAAVVRHAENMDIEDIPEGEDFVSDTQIVRWARDPAGRLCQISAELPELPSPMFEPEKGGGLVDRVVTWGANRLLETAIRRGERRDTGPPIWYLEVCPSDEAGTLLAEEELTSREEAHRRVDELVEQVATGGLGGAT